jgi:hypothetical protein
LALPKQEGIVNSISHNCPDGAILIRGSQISSRKTLSIAPTLPSWDICEPRQISGFIVPTAGATNIPNRGRVSHKAGLNLPIQETLKVDFGDSCL